MSQTMKILLAVVVVGGAPGARSEESAPPPSATETSVSRELEALVGGSFATLAPGGRLEAWMAERLRKIRHPEITRPSLLERALISADRAQTGASWAPNLGGARPTLGGLPSGSGLALGLSYRNGLGSSGLDLDLDSRWSVKGYRRHRARLGKLESLEPGGFLYADIGYAHFPREDFFAAASRPDDRADFLFDETSLGASAGYRLTPWLATRVQYALLVIDVGPGTDRAFPNLDDHVDDSVAPGLVEQPDFAKWSYSVVADRRDVPGNPHSGGLAVAAMSWYDDRARGDFAFRRVDLDGRYYVSLASRSRVLAARVWSSVDAPGNDQRVPFYFWPTLGGSRTLRGFSSYRFRGERLLHLSAEYRWEPVPAIELAVFHDAGRVWRSASPEPTAFERSSGGGVRFKSLNGVVVRVDYARSREGSRVIVDFGAAF